MRLTSLGDYAVVLMSAAARGPARLTATALAEDTGIPLPTTQKLLGRLAAAGLFRSGRGSSGGFTLTRGPHEISLADIVEAVEGPIALTTCMGEGTPCAIHDDCRVRPQMGAVNGAVRGALANVSLAQLSSPFGPSVVEDADRAERDRASAPLGGAPRLRSGRTVLGSAA